MTVNIVYGMTPHASNRSYVSELSLKEDHSLLEREQILQTPREYVVT